MSVSFVTTLADIRIDELDSTDIQFRPTKNKDNTSNHPKKPEYVPIHGYILDYTLVLYGNYSVEAEVEIYNSDNMLHHVEYFDLVTGCIISLSDESICSIILVRIGNNEYIAEI